jgi:16S rRNA (adenine1518-N6/adenine1519-N6)-dimethyltransferase
MYNHLKGYFSHYHLFHVENIDFLKCDLSKYQGKRISFISNIPYNVTTSVIEKIVTSNLDISCFEFMVQKEVYPRINAQKGNKDYAPLNIFIEYVGNLEVVRKVSRADFIPVPNVDSIILKINFNKEISHDEKFNKLFVNLVKNCFLLRRKTILNNLTSFVKSKENANEYLSLANIPLNKRPEQISLAEYLKLTKVIYENKK